MTLTVAIMAHPSRRERVERYLHPVLHAQAAIARCWGASVGEPVVLEDVEGRGTTWNRRRCLELEGDHLLVVQDDVEVCADFVEAVYHLTQMRPDAVLALAPVDVPELRETYAMGHAWADLPPEEWTRYDGSPCSVLPEWVVRRALDAGDSYPHDDALLRAVMVGAQPRVLAPVPTIAAQDNTLPSTKGGPSGKPTPPFIGTHEAAPLERYLRQRFL